MQPGDEVDVRHVSSRDTWRGEVRDVWGSGDELTISVTLASGSRVSFGRDGKAVSGGLGFYLAEGHVAKLREVQ